VQISQEVQAVATAIKKKKPNSFALIVFG